MARRVAWPAGITLLALLGAIWPVSALRNAVTRAAECDAFARCAVAPAHLERPALYSALAPLSDVLDAMSLLSVPQLIAFVVSLIIVYATWRLVRRRRKGTTGWCEICVGIRALLLLILVVMFAAVLPRPMAALVVDGPDALIFDIHSHTNYSHDARPTFTVQDNRAWHRAAGFNVAYITDHRCFDGAAEGMRGNPKLAGEGTVLLSGIELPAGQQHLVVLEPANVAVPPDLLEAWCVRAGHGDSLRRAPVIIQTIPEDLSWMNAIRLGAHTRLSGVEISDGAPRGIAQAQRDHALLVRLIEALELTAFAGSNNHGWGRTAVAWNVMDVSGWRGLTPDSLREMIEMRIHAERTLAVRVIERRTPDGAGKTGLALTLPAVVLNIARTISPAERAAWIAWAWLAWGAVVMWRRRK